MELSQLQKGHLRDVWSHEAIDFTNWLAEIESLELLSDEIDIDLTLIETEASVGKFNVDILAEETTTGKKVVIENQLETTDHDHLGKIITYASGLDAEIIIWIVKNVRDEHKQAIDWLNEHTDSNINIFAIQMEVWRIGDSPYAPKFNIIAKPNDWAKAIKKSTSQNKLSDTKLQQLDFWTKFKEFVQESEHSIKLRKAYPQHWYDVSIGSSSAHITLTINSQKELITCEMYIPDAPSLYSSLLEQKQDIENKMGYSLEWQDLPNKKACRIKLSSAGNLENEDEWPNYHLWMINNLVKMQKVFGVRAKFWAKQ
jgi:hypothetical protein